MASDTMRRTPGTPRTRETPPRETPPREKPTTSTGRPVSSPRHTRPAAPTPAKTPAKTPTPAKTRPKPKTRPKQPAKQARPRGPGRQQRMPFILLLVGLLGGALVSLLVISTTLDEGSYRITNLTNSNSELTKDIQLATQEVANEQNPGTIEQEATLLGMRQDKNLRFINTKTGKISSSAPVTP